MAHEHPATSDDQVLVIGCYKLLQTIGKGSYGKVKLAEHLPTGTHVAIKIVSVKNAVDRHGILMREIRCMRALQHPNIVQLHDAIETKESFFLVMEYVDGGSMMDHLTAHGRMQEREARVSFRQLLSAVHYFHQRGITHRDIKPENILFDQKGNVKIADFGLGTEFMDRKLNTMCCTPAYAAPELFLREPYEGPAVDVWSLGVTLYTMVAGTLPFKGQNLKQLGQQVIKGMYTVPYFFSSHLDSLLKKMLRVNPMERRGLSDIVSHPWLSQDEEDLIPCSEPVNKNIDPPGFQYVHIQDALTNRTFNNTISTYHIPQNEKPKFHPRVTHVKAYGPTEQSPAPRQVVQPVISTMPPVEQHHDDYELGQRGKKPATPPALQQVGTIKPEYSQELSTTNSRTIPEVSTGTSGSSVITPGSSPETGTPTSSSIPDSRPVSHRSRPPWRNHGPVGTPTLSSIPDSRPVSHRSRPPWRNHGPVGTPTLSSIPDSRPVSHRSRPPWRNHGPVGTPTLSSIPDSRPISHRSRPPWRNHGPITGHQSSGSETSLENNYVSSSPCSSTTSRRSSGENNHGRWRMVRRCCDCLTMLCRRLFRNNKVKPL